MTTLTRTYRSLEALERGVGQMVLKGYMVRGGTEATVEFEPLAEFVERLLLEGAKTALNYKAQEARYDPSALTLALTLGDMLAAGDLTAREYRREIAQVAACTSIAGEPEPVRR